LENSQEFLVNNKTQLDLAAFWIRTIASVAPNITQQRDRTTIETARSRISVRRSPSQPTRRSVRTR
jgi:hypothetical protein